MRRQQLQEQLLRRAWGFGVYLELLQLKYIFAVTLWCQLFKVAKMSDKEAAAAATTQTNEEDEVANLEQEVTEGNWTRPQVSSKHQLNAAVESGTRGQRGGRGCCLSGGLLRTLASCGPTTLSLLSRLRQLHYY